MDAMTKAALKVLYQRLGLWGALRVIGSVVWGQVTGAPFAGWPKAKQKREPGTARGLLTYMQTRP